MKKALVLGVTGGGDVTHIEAERKRGFNARQRDPQSKAAVDMM